MNAESKARDDRPGVAGGDGAGAAGPRGARRPLTGTLLVIGSSGGGAHLAAAEALTERLRREPGVRSVHRVDLLLDWLGPVGRFGTRLWNRAMKAGDARGLRWMVRAQRMGDRIFFPAVLVPALRALWRDRIDAVLDCQVMGTRAILTAASWVGRRQGRRVRVIKVLTEPAHRLLPQYFGPIRRLPPRLRDRIEVWASPPLLDEGETPERFWREQCGLDPAQVDEGRGFPVRTAFDGEPAAGGDLVLRLADDEARRAARASGLALRALGGGHWAIELAPGARVVTIVMGSQATGALTLDSVRAILERWDDPDLHLFVYAGDDGLRRRLAELLEARPSRTHVVGIPYQEADSLAALYRRSDATLTRSGGMTCMELLSTGRAPALVCATPSGRASRFAGMVEHEYGNFLYLERFHPWGAKIVDASDMADHLAAVLGPRGGARP
jgi:hypothetical protein